MNGFVGFIDDLGAFIPVVTLGLLVYKLTHLKAQTQFPTLRNKRICLLIAHPDDEAMFFAPTVLALTDPSLGNHVKILCLSSGMSPVTAVAGQSNSFLLHFRGRRGLGRDEEEGACEER